MNDIRFQFAKVKGYTKKYKTKDGKEKITKTNTISLGANSVFNDGDSVYVIDALDYDSLNQNQDDKEEIKQLKSDINEYSKKFQELERNFQDVFQEFKELQNANKNLQNKLDKANENKETLYNSLLIAKDKISYQEVIITKYEEMNLWKRIFKHNPKDDISASEVMEIPQKN